MTQDIYIQATQNGLCPITSMTARQRLLRQLCALGATRVFLVESGISNDTITIRANERQLQVILINSDALAKIQPTLNPNNILRDDSVFLDPTLKSWLETRHKIYNTTQEEPGHYQMTSQNCRMIEKMIFHHLGKDTDGIVSQTINRPISTFFSQYLVRLGLPPIVYTFVTGFLALIMISGLLSGYKYAILYGCILFQVTSIFDGVDGEIARATYTQSAFGARMDTGIDMVTNLLFLGGFHYALWTTYDISYALIGSGIVGFALLGIITMASLLYYGSGGGSFDVLAKVIQFRLQRFGFLLFAFQNLNYFFKRDFFALFFLVMAAFGLQIFIPWFLVFGLIIWNLAIFINAKHILFWNRISEKIIEP